MNTQALIEESFSDLPGLFDSEKSYHSPLPQELVEWYRYSRDCGHSIICILKAYEAEVFELSNDPCDFLIPVPVKAVLRSYTVSNDFIIADLDYSSATGLRVNPEDYEY